MKSITALLACSAFFALTSTADAIQATTTRVSVDSAGVEANYGGVNPSISADGRFVAFQSGADNLVANDTNNLDDVFVRDRLNGTTERVSINSAGVEANFGGLNPSISADGRFVAFQSGADNLVANDTNNLDDVFVRDRLNGTTERVSINSAGVEANFGGLNPSISADGRFVAFQSGADNLVANDTNNLDDVFVRDRLNGTTERVSINSAGVEANYGGLNPSISADGRFVAFQSSADNLVANDTNNSDDIFVRDRLNGTTERVSISSAGVEANHGGGLHPSISADGRFVAFQSDADNLVANDTNNLDDVFVRDRLNGTTERVNISSAGVEANYGGLNPSISADGRFVAFQSDADNLVANDTTGFDVFVRDRLNGTTERVSISSAGVAANYGSLNPSISADGRFVAFQSGADNLAANDTNNSDDVFVRDRGQTAPTTYCTSGTTTHGCAAQITANALPSLSLAHACNIAVTNVEGQKSGVLFYGIDNMGFAPAPWASGSTSLLCVKHPVQRTPIQNSGGTINACNGSFVLDWNAYQSVHPLALGNPWSVGDRVYAQAWFRDPLAAKSTNLSNALEMTYVP